MPVASRILKYVRPLPNGQVRVREIITSQKGKRNIHVYEAISEAVAIVDMNSRDVLDIFKTDDFSELLIHVEIPSQQLPSTFDWANRDIRENDGEDYLYLLFAGQDAHTVGNLAWWVNGLSDPDHQTIYTRLEYTASEGARIKNKAKTIEDDKDTVNDIVER